MKNIKLLCFFLLIIVDIISCKKTSDSELDTNKLVEGSPVSNLQVFPSDNVWNKDISGEEVDPNSDILITSIGKDVHLHPDFGTVWEGNPIGIPYNVVGPSQTKVKINFNWADESDPGPYPVPANALVEAGSDKHVLVVDTFNHKLYELYNAKKNGDNTWNAGSGAVFDLTSNQVRPPYYTSADAAGLAIFPGLVRYEEVVLNGEIAHALRFTVDKSRNAFVFPATHGASESNSSDIPPMGMRVRLKGSFDISGFSNHIQVILKALKKYGMFVADNGSNWYISGAPDPRWDDSELDQLKTIAGKNFEVVKMGIVTPMKN